MLQSRSERTRDLLESCARSPKDLLGRLSLGQDLPAAARNLEEALRTIEQREDPSPFRANLVLRAYRLFRDKGLLPEALWERVERALPGFVYRDFPHEIEIRHRSENLRLSYMTAEYLSAATWPKASFVHTSRPALEHYHQARNDIVDWTQWVGSYGFLEWDSSTYYGIDLMALLNLFDFAPDAFIRRRAEWVLSKLLLDIALKTFRGVYGASHGRCYLGAVTDPRSETTVNALPFFFGVGELRRTPEDAATPLDGYLITTQYRPPEILGEVARFKGSMSHRQRNRGDDRYYPPPNVPHVKNLNLYTDVNLITHRTPCGMLCSCQEYRPGEPDHQTLPWQATLGEGAIVFAGIPAHDRMDRNPHQGYWIDTTRLPRVGQFGGTLAALYRPRPDDPFRFSHLYFPVKGFEETASGPDWVAGRLGKGFVGVRASCALSAVEQGAWKDIERRAADGPAAYVCELSDAVTAGSFEAFVRALTSAPLEFDPGACNLRYSSPFAGEIRMGWEGSVRVNGDPVSLSHFPHHDGPLARSDFGSGITEIDCGGRKATLALGQ